MSDPQTSDTENGEEETVTRRRVMVVDKPSFIKSMTRSNWFVIALMTLVVTTSIMQGFVSVRQDRQAAQFRELAKAFDQEAEEGQQREALLRELRQAAVRLEKQGDDTHQLLGIASDLVSPDRQRRSAEALQAQINAAVQNIDCNTRVLLANFAEQLNPDIEVPLCEG